MLANLDWKLIRDFWEFKNEVNEKLQRLLNLMENKGVQNDEIEIKNDKAKDDKNEI